MAWTPKFTFSVTWDNITSKPVELPLQWDAPSDGKQYARQDGSWSEVSTSGGAVWGGIAGSLSDQTDLQNALNSKANDSEVVKVNEFQIVSGGKRFRELSVAPPIGGTSPEMSLVASNGNRIGVVGVRSTDGAFYMSNTSPGIGPTWFSFNDASAQFIRDVNVGRDVVADRNVVSGGDVTATGKMTSPQLEAPQTSFFSPPTAPLE